MLLTFKFNRGERNRGAEADRALGNIRSVKLFATEIDAATMAARYVDRDGYVAAVAEATDVAVEAGYLLPEDAERIKAAAGLQWDALGP